jgi:hypothetical protein
MVLKLILEYFQFLFISPFTKEERDLGGHFLLPELRLATFLGAIWICKG